MAPTHTHCHLLTAVFGRPINRMDLESPAHSKHHSLPGMKPLKKRRIQTFVVVCWAGRPVSFCLLPLSTMPGAGHLKTIDPSSPLACTPSSSLSLEENIMLSSTACLLPLPAHTWQQAQAAHTHTGGGSLRKPFTR